MERFADQATIYHRHNSGGSFTTPGTASLLTGVHPWIHRAFHLQGQATDGFARKSIFSLLPSNCHKYTYTHNTFNYILLDQFSPDIDDLIEISHLSEYSDLLADRFPFNEFTIPIEVELLSLKNFYAEESSLF